LKGVWVVSVIVSILILGFVFAQAETVVMSGIIRWNIGEVQWLEASYTAPGIGVVRIVDPDMNLNPEAVDNFDVDVWSDSDAGGIDLTVTETNEATGIFEGTVFFTTADETVGHRLRVSEGDTITAEYEDKTLPDPYTTADELDIQGTSQISCTRTCSLDKVRDKLIESKDIPTWIKTSTGWWSDGSIKDNDFVLGIQHLIQNDIIKIPNLPEHDAETAQEKIPNWIKNIGGWWATDQVSDEEFIQALHWLIANGVMEI